MWRQLVVFVGLVGFALSAVYVVPLDEKPDKFKDAEGCYIREWDTMMAVGTSMPSRMACTQYNCHENDYSMFTCGAVQADPPCYTVRDNSLMYPFCCPKIECPTDGQISYTNEDIGQ